MMREFDGTYPGYGLAQHKGYATKGHLACLRRLGSSPIHRQSFKPVRAIKEK
jgi:ribonuclease HII